MTTRHEIVFYETRYNPNTGPNTSLAPNARLLRFRTRKHVRVVNESHSAL